MSVSWPSALHCYLCLTHCSPGNVPNPTPGSLMSTPLVNTGQPTLYYRILFLLFIQSLQTPLYMHLFWHRLRSLVYLHHASSFC